MRWGRRFGLPAFAMPEHRGKLPHFQPDDTWLFLTWRLWGSPPPFVAQDRALEKQSGTRWLSYPPIAQTVARAILIGEVERQFYELSAWVVMPNHVHLLILPRTSVSVLMRWLHFGRTSPGTTTCDTPVNWARQWHTLSKTPFPPAWCALRRTGDGPAQVGRRNRLPHRTDSSAD